MSDILRSFILYDERAFLYSDTGKATVLVACESDEEAQSYKGDYGGMCCYSYAQIERDGQIWLEDERWEWNCD